MEEERENQAEQNQSKKKTPIVIGIPSYKEVIESSQMKSTPPSLFTPSHSFSQAFSFIKSSEFYSPPPQPPPATTSTVSTPRPIGEANVPSSSSSAASTSASPAAAVASSSSNSAQNRNAILVSHRQEDVVKPLLEVTKTALLHDCTLLCGWSLEECGRYLETIKVYENKPADLIQGQMDTDYLSRLNHALTTIRHVNKTDVVTLGSTFGSLSSIMDASMEDLARCPGIGERKVKRLYDAFHEPFKRVVSSNPHVPETPVCNDAEPCSASEVIEAENDTENTSKRRKKEPEMNVKSALTAAFAKYSGKISKKNNKSEGSKGGGTSATVASEAATKNSKEGV
ncbi:DNA excision repair protein ERCC-1 isoform X3 [Durio zibethinus]|uniref:DNA excision repair protein ERCC-1 isoform X3 n=1 Tax=Durio zibethinus TaxID=66656 RepID=A0A6P5Z409_DURZI|nr:DNA excision repair protein ERCC-1 isoform X3 [Durio zibethinus]